MGSGPFALAGYPSPMFASLLATVVPPGQLVIERACAPDPLAKRGVAKARGGITRLHKRAQRVRKVGESLCRREGQRPLVHAPTSAQRFEGMRPGPAAGTVRASPRLARREKLAPKGQPITHLPKASGNQLAWIAFTSSDALGSTGLAKNIASFPARSFFLALACSSAQCSPNHCEPC